MDQSVRSFGEGIGVWRSTCFRILRPCRGWFRGTPQGNQIYVFFFWGDPFPGSCGGMDFTSTQRRSRRLPAIFHRLLQSLAPWIYWPILAPKHCIPAKPTKHAGCGTPLVPELAPTCNCLNIPHPRPNWPNSSILQASHQK